MSRRAITAKPLQVARPASTRRLRCASAPALAAALAGASALLPRPARPAEPAPIALRGDARISAGIAAGLGLGYALSEIVFKPYLVPNAARWDDRHARSADTLNALDRQGDRARWTRPRVAATVSDVGLGVAALSGFGLTALAGAMGGGRLPDIALDEAIVAESTLAAMALNQTLKFIAGRERPCKHFALPSTPVPCGKDARDDNLSWFSGHTTFAAALTASSATVAFLRGYPLAPLPLGVGALLTGATGYLRVAATKHYVTDVLTGAAVGSAVGFLVPYAFHGRISASSAPSASPQPSSPAGAARAFAPVIIGFSGSF